MMFTGIAAMAMLAASPASGDPMALGRAIAAAEAATSARAIDADLDLARGGRLVHEVELIDSARRYKVEIDSITGEVLKTSSSRLSLIGSNREAESAWAAVKDGPRLGSVLDRLESETGGRVLDAQFDVEAGQARYEVEISTKAGVADIFLDPATGERIVAVYED